MDVFNYFLPCPTVLLPSFLLGEENWKRIVYTLSPSPSLTLTHAHMHARAHAHTHTHREIRDLINTIQIKCYLREKRYQ